MRGRISSRLADGPPRSSRAVVLFSVGWRSSRGGGVAWIRTAGKYRNRCGPERTRVHASGRRPAVDVLPADGMQEVWSSNLHSSTVQKRNSNESNSEYSRKVQQPRPLGPPYVCSDRACSPGWGCWQDTGFQALNRRWPACHLGKYPPHWSRDLCHLVITRPSWTAIPASGCCRGCKWPGCAGRPSRPGALPGARARCQGRAFADGGLGARRGASCRWCQSGAGPRLCSGAELRRGAARRACRRAGAPREEPGATRRTGLGLAR